MKKYLLDTNICIHFLKNEYEIPEKIKNVGFENCYLSELSLAELLFGIEYSIQGLLLENWVDVV
jgi:tRNA(fMet)-specific endonuclease VapC